MVSAPAPAPEPEPEPEPAKPPTRLTRKSRSKTASDHTYETKIVLRGVELSPGDEVLVCGDHEELGNWDPEDACPMERDGDRWHTTVTIPPGTKGSFKFLVRRKKGELVWEAGDNRPLEALPQIEARWQ